jgi:hypothetical protein
MAGSLSIPLSEMWPLTPYAFWLYCKGKIHQHERDAQLARKLMLAGAWHAAALQRVRQFPTLPSFLGEKAAAAAEPRGADVSRRLREAFRSFGAKQKTQTERAHEAQS